MTTVEQTRFDGLVEDEQTPAWEQFRKQRGESKNDSVMPRGTYEADLIEVAMLRRKDGSGYVLRMVARTVGLGRFAVAWRGLGSNGLDPWDLTEAEVKGLRKFAVSMGLPVPAPAERIVTMLRELVGERVTARVVNTPVGPQATLTRDAPGGQSSPSTSLLVVNGQVVGGDGEITEGAAADAFMAHSQFVQGVRLANEGFAAACLGAYRLRESQGWLALGFESLNEYLAQPEVTLSRTEFYRLADIYGAYVVGGGLEPVALAGASPTKLELPIPAIEQGVVSAEQAASDAESLTRRELQARYRELLGGEPDEGSSRRRDADASISSRLLGEEAAAERRVEQVDAERDGSQTFADRGDSYCSHCGYDIGGHAGTTCFKGGLPPDMDGCRAPELRASRRPGSDASDFEDDNSTHDTDCDCKSCLIDRWHGEVDELQAELEAVKACQAAAIEAAATQATEFLRDRVAELETQVEAVGDREAQLKVELERHGEGSELPVAAELALNAARTVTLTLRRVLVEIGDPSQKRMGKQLRAAVLAALDEAREHGLDAEGE